MVCVACGPPRGPNQNNPDPEGPTGELPDDMLPDDDDPVVVIPTEATSVIGAEGGSVALGPAKLSFPKNALATPTTIVISRSDTSVAGYVVYSQMYRVQPEDTTLGSPLILEIPFEADGAMAKLYWSTAADPNVYEEIEGIVVGAMYIAVIDRLGHGFVGSLIPIDVQMQLPATPAGVVAHAGDTEIDVTWNASAGATSYKVFVSLQPGAGFSTLDTTTTLKTTHIGLANGPSGTRYYKVRASNSFGDSPDSVEVTATPDTIEPPPSVTATPGDHAVTLSWQAPAHATTNASYRIFRSAPGPTGPYTAIDDSDITSTTDLTPVNGNVYEYVVQSLNPAGAGTGGTSAQAMPFALPPEASFSAAPTGPAACRYQVTWQAPTGATQYKVSLQVEGGDRQDSTVGGGSGFAPSNVISCFFMYDSATQSNTATVFVRTCYAGGCSDAEQAYSFQFVGPSGDTCFDGGPSCP